MPQIQQISETSDGIGIWVGPETSFTNGDETPLTLHHVSFFTSPPLDPNEEAVQISNEELRRLFSQLHPEYVANEKEHLRDSPLEELSEKYKENVEELNY